MEHTESQKAEFMATYASRRTRQIVVSVALIALLVPVAISSERVKGLTGLLFVLVLMAVAFSLKNWRCPACNAYLGRCFNPRFCQKCGVQLRG